MEDKFKLLIDLFDAIDIKIKVREDLVNTRLSQDTLKDRNLIEELYRKAPNLKSFYNSSKLTCLHKNSLEKQKFPAVNMYRQLLKCNNFKMEPYVISKGYNKYSGTKIVERFYRLIDLDNETNEETNLETNLETNEETTLETTLETNEETTLETTLETNEETNEIISEYD